MKRYVIVPLLIVLAVALFTNNYVIQYIENVFGSNDSVEYYFEKLSEKYYGTNEYSDELALINQAIVNEKNSIEEAELIIPTKSALVHLYNSFDMVKGREIADKVLSLDDKLMMFDDRQMHYLRGNIFSPIHGLLLFAAIAIGFIIGKKTNHGNKELPESNYYGNYKLANENGS